MPLNKERKVLLGLLGSAGLILAADQILLGPPQGASASQTPATSQPTPTPAPPPIDSTEGRDAKIEMASVPVELVDTWNARLREATTDNPLAADIADPFRAVEHFEPETSVLMTPQAFQEQHKLSSIMTGGDIGVAMINGKPVRLGQTVEGYRLIRVNDRSVEFRAGEEIVRLVLPKQGTGGS